MPATFRHFEHTADLGIEAEGATLGEAFAQAALGLFAYETDVAAVEERGEMNVVVEADTVEEALVYWLEELRFLAETKRVLFARFEASVAEGAKVRVDGRAFGEAYDESRHGHIHEVKAVTHHGAEVRRDPPRVRVVLDI